MDAHDHVCACRDCQAWKKKEFVVPVPPKVTFDMLDSKVEVPYREVDVYVLVNHGRGKQYKLKGRRYL